jgi:hypothetical protein
MCLGEQPAARSSHPLAPAAAAALHTLASFHDSCYSTNAHAPHPFLLLLLVPALPQCCPFFTPLGGTSSISIPLTSALSRLTPLKDARTSVQGKSSTAPSLSRSVRQATASKSTAGESTACSTTNTLHLQSNHPSMDPRANRHPRTVVEVDFGTVLPKSPARANAPCCPAAQRMHACLPRCACIAMLIVHASSIPGDGPGSAHDTVLSNVNMTFNRFHANTAWHAAAAAAPAVGCLHPLTPCSLLSPFSTTATTVAR